jgi:hypothetical protein
MCQTYGDKVISQEGNSPKQEFKVPKLLFSVKKEFTWTNLISVLAWRLPQLEEYVIIHWFWMAEKTLINLLELKQYTVSLRSSKIKSKILFFILDSYKGRGIRTVTKHSV